jgi:hypothetical protein
MGDLVEEHHDAEHDLPDREQVEAPGAVQRDRETSMNPAVLDAAALAIVAASGHGFPGVAGHEPDAAAAQSERDHARAATKVLADATPGAGSYVNETDYFRWRRCTETESLAA